MPLHYIDKTPTSYIIGGPGRNKDSLRFDNVPLIIEKEVVHIDSITFGYNLYLIGFTVSFNINGRRVTQKHYSPN